MHCRGLFTGFKLRKGSDINQRKLKNHYTIGDVSENITTISDSSVFVLPKPYLKITKKRTLHISSVSFENNIGQPDEDEES